MPYKRPEPKKSEKVHPLQTTFGIYGMINTSNDPGWISSHLTELMDDGLFALHQFSTSIDSAKGLNMSDYKHSIAAAKRAELILKGKRALMSFLRKHIEKYKSEANAVSNALLRVTEPAQPTDPMKAMLQEMRFREIRDNLKNTDPKHRRQAVAGNLERLQAIIANPDPINIILSEETMTELRRDFAFKQDPTLIEQEKDQREIYKAIRARAAEINATSEKMLIYAKMESPLPPAEHFEVFDPQTEHEKVLAADRIELYEKQQMKIARYKELAETNTGINLGVDDRVKRLAGGPKH
ncbi:MAG: hypothetical protein V1766_09500 [Pseudomonadota bacterium]